MSNLTQEILRERLHYDLLSGVFTWREDIALVKKGDIAGGPFHVSGKSYISIGINRKKYQAHRLAFLYVLSEFPENQVDHINGNGLDNRWINLRKADSKKNAMNRRLPANNTSKIIGVYFQKKENIWTAQVKINQKNIYLGCFKNKDDAVKARKKAEIKYGFHPNHGQVRPL